MNVVQTEGRKTHDVLWPVAHDTDLLCWCPRADFTRAQAHTRMWRSLRSAGWPVPWTRIRVVARHLRLDPRFHENEGRFVECDAGDYGATPVWRCETIATDPMFDASYFRECVE